MIAEQKKNFIFDLYGTLADVCIDETMPQLWQWLAEHYTRAGAGWDAAQIHSRYLELIREKETALARKLKTEYPEIDFRDVFRDLYMEKRREAHSESPKNEDKGSSQNEDGRALPLMDSPADLAGWIDSTAAKFRSRSRLRFRLFPGTLPALRELHRRGKKVYLLSNAQACFTVGEMEQLKLTPMLDSICISSDYQMKKPERRFMQKLLEKEHLNPADCVMIGNEFPTDVATALQWNIDCIFLNTDGFTRKEREQRLEEIRRKYHAPDFSTDVIETGKIMQLFR